MSTVNGNNLLSVIALEIDEEGKVSKKHMAIDRESQLENTLLKADYPGIHAATIDIPQQQLDQYQQSMVEHSLGKKIVYDGTEYCLVGASASAKNGKYYAVDATHAKSIAHRYRFWPEAAMTYFGILVSPCKALIEVPDARVLVVKDHKLGTNDCRGWIRRSLFNRLNLAANHFYQFRLSFDGAQAKGSFKVMEDDAADALSADIVIPRSSCKPEYKRSETALRCFAAGDRVSGQYSTGRVVIGIREISRGLEFSSSYTLVEHAPVKSIETEIKPLALLAVEKVKNAARYNDFGELFRVLGVAEDIELLHSEETVEEPEHTSSEHTVIEAVLKADPTGYWVRHPFVNSHLQRMLAKWAYKLCTAGGFTLPAFALADDGYLVLHDGKIYSGSDWIPEWTAITSLASGRMLVVRYPIRTKGDLLPVRRLSSPETRETLMRHLAQQQCPMDPDTARREIVSKQVALEGTFTLHSETAKKNGGDYDFDWICVVEGDRFPIFVEDRFAYRGANRRKTLMRKRNQAQAALHFFEERSRQEMRNLINIIRKWAERKEDRALDWLTALWDHCSRSRRTDANRPPTVGSIVFYAFPQHVVDQIVEKTGGRPITVALPKLVDGEVHIDPAGNVYLVDQASDGAGSHMRRQTLILQIPGDGRMLSDGGRSYQVARFSVQPGPAQIRDGKLELPNTAQRPGVPNSKQHN